MKISADSLWSALRDVSLIVVSILIAFALDAWWGGVQENRGYISEIRTLRSELDGTRSVLSGYRDGLAASGAATASLMESMGPDPDVVPPPADSVASLVSRSFGLGALNITTTALDRFLAGDAVTLLSDSSRERLHALRVRLQLLLIDGEHLERNRDEELHSVLVEAGVPWLPGVALEGFADSRFEPDYGAMFTSLAVYSSFRYRGFRMRRLENDVSRTIERLTEITAALDSELDGR